MNTLDISAVICSHNNAPTIGRCLESVDGFGELIVADAFSTDDTLEAARRYPAVVYRRHKNDGAGRWDWAVSRANRPWVLLLDAAEYLTPSLRKSIEEAGEPAACGYRMRLSYEYLGAPMKSLAYQRFTRPRLLMNPSRDNPPGGEKRGEIAVLPGGKLGRRGYEDVGAHIQAINEATTRVTACPTLASRMFAPPAMIIAPGVAFVSRYILRGGVLDGARGFLYCLLEAYSVFIRYAKVCERGFSNSPADKTGKGRKRTDFLARTDG